MAQRQAGRSDHPRPRAPSLPRLSLPKRRLPTPFGSIEFPQYSFPPRLRRFKVDQRKGAVLRNAVGQDLAGLVVGFVPIVGDAVASKIIDLHGSEIRDLMTPKEYDRFVRAHDKVAWPTVLAAAVTFMEEEES